MNQLFKIVTIITLFTTLFSCRTAQELVQKAKEKDPNIILCKDSIVETLIPGETITLYGKDSVHIKTNRVDILATYDSLGLKVSYKLKDTVVKSTETTPVITPAKTKAQIRQENRTQRNKDDQKGKTERKGIKADNKLDIKKEGTKKVEIKVAGKNSRTVTRQENKRGNWMQMLIIGIVIGSVGMFLFMFKFWRG